MSKKRQSRNILYLRTRYEELTKLLNSISPISVEYKYWDGYRDGIKEAMGKNNV